MTVAELQYGVYNSSHIEKNRISLAEFLAPFDVLDFDDSDAEKYGTIRADLSKAGILIGPYDLSASLGKPGEINDPTVQSAIDTVIRSCQNTGVSMGFFGISSEAVLPYKEKGFTLLTVGVDAGFIIKSATQTLSEMHD